MSESTEDFETGDAGGIQHFLEPPLGCSTVSSLLGITLLVVERVMASASKALATQASFGCSRRLVAPANRVAPG